MSNLVVWARRRTGLLALVFVLAIVVIAACTDSEGPTATSVPPTATSTTVAVAPTATQIPPTATQPAPTATPMSEEDDPGAAVGVLSVEDFGEILVGPDRLTLYIFDNDTEGVSNCSGGCLGAWPPLLTDYGVVALGDITAELGTITRDDGTMLVTVNGFPAYYWQNDAAAGDTGGQARGNVWWVFGEDGTAIRN